MFDQSLEYNFMMITCEYISVFAMFFFNQWKQLMSITKKINKFDFIMLYLFKCLYLFLFTFYHPRQYPLAYCYC